MTRSFELRTGPVLALLAGLATCAPAPATRPPDVFLIVCDTLRADHLGCYGHERDTTPHLDALARGATRFETALAQAPATIPSMWCLFTSRYQAEWPTASDTLTLAEAFRSRGYRTGAFLAQHFLLPDVSQLAPGFDVYDVTEETGRHGVTTRTADSVVDAAIEWLDEDDRRPAFVWMVVFDPHDPYDAPPGFRGEFNRGQVYHGDRRSQGLHHESREVTPAFREFLVRAYDEEIRFMDSQLGRFFEHLRARGRFDGAALAFTSDHGEELGDNGHRWDHSQLLSPEEVHVPMIVKTPGQTEGRVLAAPVQTIDLYPTLIELAERGGAPGGDPGDDMGARVDGTSLVPLLDGLETTPRLALSLWKDQMTVVDGEHQYWVRGEEAVLLRFPSKEPVEDPARAAELRAALGELIERHEITPDYYGEAVELLEELGYFDAPGR